MIALPSIIEDLLSKHFIHTLLVGVVGAINRYRDARIIDLEAIVAPETVVEGEGSRVLGQRTDNLCGGALHLYAALRVLLQFSLVKGSNSDRNFYAHIVVKYLFIA